MLPCLVLVFVWKQAGKSPLQAAVLLVRKRVAVDVSNFKSNPNLFGVERSLKEMSESWLF